MHILCRHPKPYPILIGALTLTLTDGLICKRNLNSFDVPNTVSNLTLTNGSYDKQIPKNKIPTSIKSMVVIIDDYDKTLIGLPDHLERLHIVYNYGQLPKHVTKDRHVPGIPFLNGLPMHLQYLTLTTTRYDYPIAGLPVNLKSFKMYIKGCFRHEKNESHLLNGNVYDFNSLPRNLSHLTLLNNYKRKPMTNLPDTLTSLRLSRLKLTNNRGDVLPKALKRLEIVPSYTFVPEELTRRAVQAARMLKSKNADHIRYDSVRFAYVHLSGHGRNIPNSVKRLTVKGIMLNKKKFSFDGWSTGLQKLIIKVRPLRISDYSEISSPDLPEGLLHLELKNRMNYSDVRFPQSLKILITHA